VTELGQLVDHAADLQRQVDQLWRELVLVWAVLLALSIIVTVGAWRAWQP
jgi:hypothetical protein